MAKRVVSATGKVKQIVEEKRSDMDDDAAVQDADSSSDGNSEGGDGNGKATLKDWAIVIGTIVVILALLSSCVRSCFGGNRKDETKQEAVAEATETESSDTKDDQAEQESEPEVSFDNDYAEHVLNSFVEAYNRSDNVVTAITNEISIDDLNSTQKGHFNNQLKSAGSDAGLYGVYELGTSKDRIVIAYYTKDGNERIRVLGMYDKNGDMVNSFKNAFFLISSDTTEDDFNKLVSDEIFLYSGKDGGIKGIDYDISTWGGYHTVLMDTAADKLNFKIDDVTATED